MLQRENADGSISGIREVDCAEVFRIGGYSGPAGSNVPGYPSTSLLAFNVAGGTDTAGGLLSWQNTLGYDILIVSHQLDVTTKASAACTASFGGTAVSGTTSASNMISAQDVGTATGTFNGGALSVKVLAGSWITGSKASGASAGLIARAYFTFMPAAAAGGK